ncbi:branched-chain amino acid ABC transporter permease [Xylanimonas ulmi]|uniref:Amino acid/amide ABC transporter membrane protein 1 (HAAT family) n=1 Tax=Xylanimonas ulmi TaxID=228973 RepID=A0A4Q7M662_9MICO|nr:branched-chain amino acid ABC transporter permease [Xylanibacterium ulmi]RZS61539.1 amino acid/amide ABC transporter membrane protein 1 (HAAT family) [Xylanibacterium ulmi]
MDSLLSATANGLSLGALYAVMALGFVVIYRATGVLNFAHGAILLTGVYIASVVSQAHGYAPGALAGVGAGATVAVVAETVFLRHSKTRDHITLTILTLGLNILLVTEVSRRIGTHTLPLHDPIGNALTRFGGLTLPTARVLALVVSLVVITAFLLAFRLTRWGLAMRVSTADAEVASLMGVRLSVVSWTSWAIGGALAVISGLFLASFPAPGVTPSLADTAFRAFPAAVLGGLGSVGGALVGGILLGLAEAFAATYEGALGSWAHNLSGISAWLLLLVVLLLRPEGLFSARTVRRV